MSDGSAPWIKLITRIFEDPKIIAIEQLPDGYGLLIIWFKLLTLAGEQNRGGMIYFTESVPFTADLLAAKWRCKPTLVQMALEVFKKLGMIGIDQEQTILILNWSRYQNEEGLSRIRERGLLSLQDRSTEKSAHRRELATARQRKHRQIKRQHSPPNRAVTAVTRDRSVTGVTVTPQSGESQRETVTPQNKNKSKSTEEEVREYTGVVSTLAREDETQAHSRALRGETDIFEEDIVQHSEAKTFFAKLSIEVFEKVLQPVWPDDLAYYLDRILPVKATELELVGWFYRIPANHRIFGVTLRRKSLRAVLQNFDSEVQKIRTARKLIGLDSTRNEQKQEPEKDQEEFPCIYWDD
jgi:predicted phage replisome organizer